MTKPLRSIVVILIVVVLLVVAAVWLFTAPTTTEESTAEGGYILQTSPENVIEIKVNNMGGSYTMNRQGESAFIGEISDSILNVEYVTMLIDECSNIAYEELVEAQPDDLSLYGLDNPLSTVDISYADTTSLTLLFGDEEIVSGGRYAKLADSPEVYLFAGGRTVRFMGGQEQFIDYIIVPPNQTPDLLGIVGDVTISGTQLPQAVTIKAVDSTDSELMTQALSFGAVTHMITSPGLYEVDPSYLTKFAESLLGLISEGIVDYNCTDEELAQYGFDTPLLEIEFDVREATDAPYERSVIKLSQLPDGSPIVTVDDEGVVYKILDGLDFTDVSYDKLILRWFLSPLITEISQIELSVDGKDYLYILSGDTTQDLSATCNGQTVDTAQFRQLYTLLVSAAGEGMLPERVSPPDSTPVFSLTYHYKNEQKSPDALRLYESENLRRMLVEINGQCEFEMLQDYAPAVAEAAQALLAGQSVE